MLEAAGSSLAKVVKVNALIYSMLECENMNSVYREFFPVDPPARTVCGAGLIGGHKVEIEFCLADAVFLLYQKGRDSRIFQAQYH